MRCNCCVELRDGVVHRCISQVLEGTCPICAENLRFSMSDLKGLPCGHVLHLECYQQYRVYSYTCPICLKSMDDMRDYFSRLDQAAASMPVPNMFIHTRSRILCHDCGQTSRVQYRTLHHKCPVPTCGSYNTRVLEAFVVRPGEN